MAEDTVIKMATKSTMNAQTALWDRYKWGTAAMKALKCKTLGAELSMHSNI